AARERLRIERWRSSSWLSLHHTDWILQLLSLKTEASAFAIWLARAIKFEPFSRRLTLFFRTVAWSRSKCQAAKPSLAIAISILPSNGKVVESSCRSRISPFRDHSIRAITYFISFFGGSVFNGFGRPEKAFPKFSITDHKS